MAMSTKRILKPILLVALAGGLVAAYPVVFPEKALEVEIFRAAQGEVRETVTSPNSGTVVSRLEAVVAAEANGRVARVVHRHGERVEAGRPVVLLEDADAVVEVRAAEALRATRQTAIEIAEVRAKKAEEDLASAEPIWKQKLMSEEQFRVWRTLRDTARGDVEAARRLLAEATVAVERAQVALAKRRVVAPFTGTIRRKLVEAGEHVIVGTPCFEMFDHTDIFVRAPIDEVDIPKIQVGFPVDIALEPFADRLFKGEVRDIEPGVRTAKELNRTGEVEVEILDTALTADASGGSVYPVPPGAPLRVGMSADIEIITRTSKDGLRVPAYAVHEDDVERFVYLVSPVSRVERRVVTLGLSNYDYAEIASGLQAGEAVVVSLDLKDLAPGKLAKIKREVLRASADAAGRP